MKRLIAAAAILILLIVICFFGNRCVVKICNETNDKISKCYEAYNKNDYPTAVNYASDIYEDWHQKQIRLAVFVNHSMLDDISKLRSEVRSLRLKDIEREAEALLSVSGNKVILLPEREISELIAFSNIAISKISGILVLLSGNEGEYKYVISSNSVNLKEEASKINNRLLGRGGGKPNMIQGSFSCSLKEIEDYFSL